MFHRPVGAGWVETRGVQGGHGHILARAGHDEGLGMG